MKKILITSSFALLFGIALTTTVNGSVDPPVDMGKCYFKGEACNFVGKGACAFCDH